MTPPSEQPAKTADLRQDSAMADRYPAPGGWTVDVIQLPTGDRPRIRHHGFSIADVINARVLLRPRVDDVTGPVILDAACGTGVSLSPGTHKQDP